MLFFWIYRIKITKYRKITIFDACDISFLVV